MQHDYRVVALFELFVIFSSIAVFSIFKPLRNKGMWTIVGSLLMLLLISYFYITWGGFGEYYAYKKADDSQQKALQVLKKIKTPDELIVKLEKHLEVHPESARGWYLLGRIYSSQHHSKKALRAFAKAYILDARDELITANYASLLLENGEETKGRAMLEKLLLDNPKQQDALAILAMDAYRKNNTKFAVLYWRRLLDTLPAESAEADAIRLAIAKARTL